MLQRLKEGRTDHVVLLSVELPIEMYHMIGTRTDQNGFIFIEARC